MLQFLFTQPCSFDRLLSTDKSLCCPLHVRLSFLRAQLFCICGATYYLLDANINDDILHKVHQVHEIGLKHTKAFYTRSLSYLEIHPGLCQNRGGKGLCWNCFWTSFLGSWSSLKSIFVRQNYSQHGFIHLYFSKPTFDRHFANCVAHSPLNV